MNTSILELTLICSHRLNYSEDFYPLTFNVANSTTMNV